MVEITKMSAEEKRAWAVSMLIEMQTRRGRLPRKDDFDVVTLSRIKAFLGPWPRALETAGLKKVNPKSVKNRKSQKRRRGKCLPDRNENLKYGEEIEWRYTCNLGKDIGGANAVDG